MPLVVTAMVFEHAPSLTQLATSAVDNESANLQHSRYQRWSQQLSLGLGLDPGISYSHDSGVGNQMQLTSI